MKKYKVVRTLRPGESIVFNGVELVLIEIRRGHGRRAVLGVRVPSQKTIVDSPPAKLDDTSVSQS